jgi:predicted nucleic-acid-binding Zn-ribbon protein
MRKNLVCPKCDGRKFWSIGTMHERGDNNAVAPFNVTVESRWAGLDVRAAGTFETFICAGCGYTEWYARGLDQLKEDPKNGIYFIDTEPKAGLR